MRILRTLQRESMRNLKDFQSCGITGRHAHAISKTAACRRPGQPHLRKPPLAASRRPKVAASRQPQVARREPPLADSRKPQAAGSL
jgi:hypothetical protein